MAIESWTPGFGVGLTWTALFSAGASLASLAINASMLDSTGPIGNGTSLDIFADLSVQLAAITTVAPAQLNIFIYPLNGDATTYGDGQFAPGTSGLGTPAPNLYVGTISFPVATATAQVGILERIVLPPGAFRFLIQNQTGAILAASGNAVQYRTYNRKVV